MPKKYAKRKQFKRRNMRGKRKSTVPRSNMVVSRSSPVPDRYFTKLNYTDLVTLNYALALTTYQFRTNSIFDPNLTGTGHQPMGHDQLGNLYNKYRVYGCKYVITFSNTNPAYQGEVIVQNRPNTTLSANFEDAMESPYHQYKILGAETSGPKVIKGYANCAKVYGVSKQVWKTDDNYQANIGSNPSAGTILNIYAQNQTVGTALTILARVNLTYFVEFYERKILGSS